MTGKFMALLSIFALGILIPGCQSSGKTVVESIPSDHTHRLSNTKVIGNYHVSFSVDHQLGEVAIIITDAHEKPLKIKEPYLNAVLTLNENGKRMVKQLKLKPLIQNRQGRLFIMRRGRISGPFSSIFLYRAHWLKLAHDFIFDVKVPIKGTMYGVSFTYSIPSEENQHHHHFK